MKVSNICKSFGINKILDNVSFDANENLAIVGQSGGGKTTLLRILAGLETADSGTIEYMGKIGFVFQDFNLFPHMTVWENITLASPNTDERLLTKLGLEQKKNEYPCNLSGGQKQRVAIARALALNPDVLCFDEPTSALDPILTDSVAKLINSLGKVCIIVTHDMEFANKVAKRKLVIDTKKYLRYEDLKDILVADNGERFVKVKGKFVRETVAKMLPEGIIIDCGWRSLEEQKRRFDEQLAIYKDVEEAHRFIAEPTVAGHPTGGAIDVYFKGMNIDFKDCEYNPQNENQYKLRMLMLEQGFAPFDGEWWHFSYGDKEWAAYYNKSSAIYEQKDLAYSYQIYSPCGNITALVQGIYDDKKQINDEIQNANPEVEQVGFLGNRILEMAGGEFCGNASRSAVYSWLKGKQGELEIKCSGCPDTLTGGIDENGDVYIKGIKIRRIISNKVEMDGITHFIVPNSKNRKEIANKIINANKNYPCVGVIFFIDNVIIPVVWVRDVNTIYWEKSCASGSIAFSAWRGNGEYKILQPSQDFLKVKVENNVCEISGKVEKI